MNKTFWKYLGIYTGVYLLIALCEIFLLSPLVDFFGNSFWIRFLVYSIMFLLINPFPVRAIGDRIASMLEAKQENSESE
ncbi:MAG: hypothetical protein II529_00825 [Erysipelotrichaceae bacterium]|jgi:hypothetical protein|nr:hypothetical protein [Erysipelotrichaceae bacterium]